MIGHFHKMEGCGNDFVVMRWAELGDLPDRPTELEEFIRKVCNRHYGIGADGLLAWGVTSDDHAPLKIRMHYWNADGSRAEMCGNGARCVVRIAWDEQKQPQNGILLETDAGTRPATVDTSGAQVVVGIDMGQADWQPQQVPFESTSMAVDEEIDIAGLRRRVSALSMGNPHAVVFLESRQELEDLDLATHAAPLATHARFPQGANASFVFIDGDVLHLRVWERGVGPTLACGTASCAALAAARRTERFAGSTATIQLPGGRVTVRQAADEHLWLAGPATYVAEGTLHPDWLALRHSPQR
jgi:diaminopimelate epimerase